MNFFMMMLAIRIMERSALIYYSMQSLIYNHRMWKCHGKV